MITVLVVDDDFRVAGIHRAVIDHQPGFTTVAVAHTGAEALDCATRFRPELILLDLYLPDMFGLDVINRIRVAGVDAEVIVISAADEYETIERAHRLGASSYLLKPFPLTELSARLVAFQQRRSATHADTVAVQAEIDQVFHPSGGGRPAPLPKGLSAETAQLVWGVLSAQPATQWSAQACAEGVGISRVSARRYMEFFAGQGRMTVSLRYGAPGRPERLFQVVDPPPPRTP